MHQRSANRSGTGYALRFELPAWTTFVELDEPLYALVYLWLVISGAGWISLDHLIRSAVGQRTEVPRTDEAAAHQTS
jgi:hypothetical protein